MNREKVYQIIDGERDYQEKKWKRPEHIHNTTEYLVYIRHYVNLALTAVSTEDGDETAKDIMRKIAALAVASMEENGATERAPSVSEPPNPEWVAESFSLDRVF